MAESDFVNLNVDALTSLRDPGVRGVGTGKKSPKSHVFKSLRSLSDFLYTAAERDFANSDLSRSLLLVET